MYGKSNINATGIFLEYKSLYTFPLNSNIK